ncbi:IS3 family transposase [Rhodococcus triatomae]|nr:transposase [Rhodococcus triatomae BKS 15-14]
MRAIIALKADHRLAVLLEVAGLARSTFFYHQTRLGRPDPRAELEAAIGEVFERNRGRYGHRRVHQELIGAGHRVAKKTVLTLMRKLALVCRVRRRRHISYRGQVGHIAANLLDRQFATPAPNRVWVTDVTEFRVGDRKLYLSPVMDLFDRQIISYTLGPSPTLELTNTSLEAALESVEDTVGLLVHSDQGFQYQHRSWRRLLDEAGARQSMSRKGNCLDNAMIENFFGHLKEEMFHRIHFHDIEALAAEIDMYIHWYNTERISTTLNGLSPVRYRAQAIAA